MNEKWSPSTTGDLLSQFLISGKFYLRDAGAMARECRSPLVSRVVSMPVFVIFRISFKPDPKRLVNDADWSINNRISPSIFSCGVNLLFNAFSVYGSDILG